MQSTCAFLVDVLADIVSQESCNHVYLAGYLVADLVARPDLAPKFSHVYSIKCAGERLILFVFSESELYCLCFI